MGRSAGKEREQYDISRGIAAQALTLETLIVLLVTPRSRGGTSLSSCPISWNIIVSASARGQEANAHFDAIHKTHFDPIRLHQPALTLETLIVPPMTPRSRGGASLSSCPISWNIIVSTSARGEEANAHYDKIHILTQ